jgi:hypothetical protein
MGRVGIAVVRRVRGPQFGRPAAVQAELQGVHRREAVHDVVLRLRPQGAHCPERRQQAVLDGHLDARPTVVEGQKVVGDPPPEGVEASAAHRVERREGDLEPAPGLHRRHAPAVLLSRA